MEGVINGQSVKGAERLLMDIECGRGWIPCVVGMMLVGGRAVEESQLKH